MMEPQRYTRGREACRKNKFAVLFATFGTATQVCSAALAQTPQPPTGDAGGLTEIIVTAQKRSESIQSVPITISALTSDALADANINGAAALQSLVPGLVTGRSLSNAVPYLRGVGQNDGVFGAESPVGMYIDGVYIVSPASTVFSFNSIERIEVLKGPQGTLFGRNATGGVVQVITRDPSMQTSMDMDVGYANYETTSGRFYGTTGITDNLAANVALYAQKRDRGFVRNLTDGSRIYDSSDFAAQTKWRWDPGAGTSLLLNYVHDQHTGTDALANGSFPGATQSDGVSRYVDAWSFHAPRKPRFDQIQDLGSLRLTHDLSSGVTLSNLAAYHRMEQNAIYSQSPLAPPATGAILANPDIDEETFSNEFQLQAPAGSDLQWIAGLYYLHNEGTQHMSIYSLAATGIPGLLSHFDSTTTTESYAVFAQATKAIVPATRLTAGVRYTHDSVELTGEQYAGGTQPFGTDVYTPGTFVRNPGTNQPLPFRPEVSGSEPTWRLAIDHDLADDIMVFASYNRGYRSGNFNQLDYTNPPTNPEKLDAYELGLKSELLDNRLRFNVSGFYYDYKNMQLKGVGPTPPTLITYNAGAAEIIGLDMDFSALVGSRLSIFGGMEILPRAKYTVLERGSQTYANPYPFGFVAGVPVVPPGCIGPVTGASPTLGGAASAGCNLSGNRLLRSPKLSANLNIKYEIPLDQLGTLTLSAGDAYNSGYYFQDDSALEQPSFHDVRASITWSDANDRLSVQLWGNNLTNDTAFAYGFTGTRGYAYVPGDPRFYGVKVGYRY